ncbi:MAG: hypothetical protein AB1757_16585 [Acidobacteriota bacterium]
MAIDANLRLLFLASKKFESGKAVRGAFLLTDLNTKPVEFRCTNPIRPTTLQTMLYGDILEQHMMVDLIGIPLVNSIKEHPSLILVREQSFLGIRPKIDLPIIQIASEESIPISMADDGSGNQLLHSKSGRFEPVVLMTHNKFTNDREHAKTILNEIIETHNLLEPFNRIETALEQVHGQKIGEEK